MHDDHRKLSLTKSFIFTHLGVKIALFLILVTLPFTHIVRPRLKGGDPAAGSPTATLLRLLPRC